MIAVPGTLPSGITERYLYKDIVALTDDDKAANAHGYALLATGKQAGIVRGRAFANES